MLGLGGWGVQLSVAVSPCLPIENVANFADWISEHADFAIVDSFVAGDGSKGRRTRHSFPWKTFDHHSPPGSGQRALLGAGAHWSRPTFFQQRLEARLVAQAVVEWIDF